MRKNQKLFIVINGVIVQGITRRMVDNGLFGNAAQWAAIRHCFLQIESANPPILGYGCNIGEMSVQVSLSD